ncbi:MAG: metal ABC transporter permease, partial [Chlamydiia bacterium]|nr:metal ABC transporter permease [Chlamydiia bacterium]
VRYDSALCFVLASFFGIGITMASRVQFTHTALYRQIQIYLYGQAATMRDFHILLYLGMALLVIISISLTYRRLQILLLDREFAHTLGMRTRTLNTFFFLLIVLAIIVGIRCVGVVLMSAMLIAPAATARQFTHRLWQVMILAGFVGMLSGFLGNYLSVELARSWSGADGGRGFALPTGPSVVLTGSALCFLALLFAPERGLVVRYLRILIFRQRCVRENLLKALWRVGEYRRVPATELRRYYSGPRLYLNMLLRRMIQDGLVAKGCGRTYTLTDAGRRQGAHIVRLH